MNGEISPLERAREILRSIEIEEEKLAENNEVSSEYKSIELIESDTAAMPETVKTEPGPPPAADKRPAFTDNFNNILNFDQGNLLRGLIFSEILGRPKSRRRFR